MKLTAALAFAALSACGEPGSDCGPTEAVVARVIDGDTVELEGGVRIRYLMVNTPETTGGKMECYGENATKANRDLVEGKTVTLTYDQQCTDRFGRTLAYVHVGNVEVNTFLVERGYACVLHIPPNGDDRNDEFKALERAAKAAKKGLWGQCDPIPCN
ncbi:MAG: thermonuclease family protein [Deltaproteobacteria bacterium]|nr:thermonuclease family protein [Deltaproteobacteria bacterium]MCW5806122.1 thermonuclease family protein [Deltaproteobacteria bacterium]